MLRPRTNRKKRENEETQRPKPKAELNKSPERENGSNSDEAEHRGQISPPMSPVLSDQEDEHIEEEPERPASRSSRRGSIKLGKSLRESFKESKSAVKEQMKRPLSSWLRRPGSRSGSRERSGAKADITEHIAENSHNARPMSAVNKKQGAWGDAEAERPGTAMKKQSTTDLSKRGIRPPTAAGRRPPGLIDMPQELVEAFDGKATVDVESKKGSRKQSPDILQIEELASQEFGTGVARAPQMTVHNVATIKELDTDLSKAAAFAALDNGIDLHVLAKHLKAESEVDEESVAWTWDYLFTSVASDFKKPENFESDHGSDIKSEDEPAAIGS